MDLLAALTAATFALVGVVVGHLLAARSDNRADRWRRREETMRMLRWSVELAASGDDQKWSFGVAAIEGLLESELLQPEDTDVVKRLAHQVRLEPGGYDGPRSAVREGGDEHG